MFGRGLTPVTTVLMAIHENGYNYSLVNSSANPTVEEVIKQLKEMLDIFDSISNFGSDCDGTTR